MLHKGDLPGILVQAGISLLDEKGAEALTLRRIAARAGVSHAAPAHHFGGLGGLCIAIAKQGYQQLVETLIAARNAVPAKASPDKRLLAVAQAYVRFAATRADLFNFMCSQLAARDAGLRMRAFAVFLVFADLCQPFVDGKPAIVIQTAVWTVVHGYAALYLDDPPPAPNMVTASLADALRLVIG